MNFKRLSIVTVIIFVALLLLFLPSPVSSPKNILTVGQVLAAATQNTTKSVTALTIQDQQIDLSAPNASVKITLPGDATTSIPIVITYDDGTTRYLTYTFNYKPPAQPAPAFCSNEDFATACWQGAQCQEENQSSADDACSQNHGSGSRCTRSTGQPDIHDDGCTTVTEPVPPPPSPPEPSCGDYQYIRAECDWGRQQIYDVYQDSCGNYDRRNYQTQPGQCGAPAASTAPGCNSSDDFSEYLRCGGCGEEIWACYDEDGKHERRFYGGDTAGYCTGSDWCGGGGSEPPAPECEDVYYCDNGTTIHKHGYHDGNECQYTWDDLEEPC